MSDILIGKGDKSVQLLAKYGNRHGLVAGATGTGKTITLEVLAEGFSRMGVPVFISDVKGDVAGVALAGTASDKLQQRAAQTGVENFAPEACPVIFWDLYGKAGHPVRATISEIGPTLLARMLELNDTQEGVLEIVFKMADDRGLLLLDLDDLRALLTFTAENQKEISTHYGLVSTQSISAIQRSLVSLERDGGDSFFGEPALELADLMRGDMSGRGVVNILAADQLVLKPRLYSSFLLWLLSELFENLPEVGDLDKPKLVFFFDEAHLLFNDAPPALRQRVEQVVRLIRSKGVGVYFCSQFPDDIPTEILGQLGNRAQHALRAFTPRDQKAVKTAAETFVPNPKLDVAQVISQLGVGEALVSTLQEQAIPMPVERTMICPPRCRMGAITPDERNMVRSRSPVGGKYDTRVNRESAYEMLSARKGVDGAAASAAPAGQAPQGKAAAGQSTGFGAEVSAILFGSGRRQGMVEAMAKSTARTVGSQMGRQILRGVLGGIFGGSKRK
ncbi:MAG TPA: helicase HerA-like domain-containing protein [Pirellulales bacterium]